MRRLQWANRPALLAILFGLAAGSAFAQPSGQVEELTRKADLVFRGTVQRVGAANLSAVIPGRDTVVVRIEEFLKAPDGARDFAGREVTVKLGTPGSAKVGEKAIFFASTWLDGESLGVVEIGRLGSGAPGIRSQVAEAGRRMREEEILQHLGSAALVVTGRVVATRPAGIEAPLSEHSPVWWEAVIQVDSVLKGKAGDRVVLLYPRSMDVAWYRTPKPEVGWDGVWLLQGAEEEELRARAGAYTAPEPWNVMSRDDAGLVRKLVRP
jgi:hypothetical protein